MKNNLQQRTVFIVTMALFFSLALLILILWGALFPSTFYLEGRVSDVGSRYLNKVYPQEEFALQLDLNSASHPETLSQGSDVAVVCVSVQCSLLTRGEVVGLRCHNRKTGFGTTEAVCALSKIFLEPK